VNSYEHLVGEHFTRNGMRYTVVKCVGATVVAGYLKNNRVHRVLVRLADVLDALEVTEINITAPVVDNPGQQPAGARPRGASNRA
jgi:hypothetical protein